MARRWILEASVSATHRSLLATVLKYWGRSFWFKQIIPIVTTVGPAVCAFAVIGFALALGRRGAARAALLILAALPGLAFWLVIEGNNTRHVADYWLLLLWAACLGWQLRKPRWLLAAAALAVAANWLIIPPNSNVALYPSPNVFLSHQLHAGQVNAIARVIPTLRADAESAQGPVCYLGYATTPFVQQDLALAAHAPQITTFNDGWRRVRWQDQWRQLGGALSASGRTQPGIEARTPSDQRERPGQKVASHPGASPAVAFLVPAYNRWDFLHQAKRCQQRVSIEFTSAGYRLRYFGAELRLPASVVSLENWVRRREVLAEGWP